MSVTALRESHNTVGAEVDREGRVVRGVKLIGKISKWGYSYSDEALKSALPLYENAPVYIDHRDKDKSSERSLKEKIGWISGVRWNTDGAYGDFNFLENHPSTGMVLEWAERNPKGIGFSQDAKGRVVGKGSNRVVESITAVRSVDLVDCPATTNGLFESFSEEEEEVKVKSSIRKLVESHGTESEKKHLSLLEGRALLDFEIEIDEPGESASGVVATGMAAVGSALVEGGEFGQLAELSEVEQVLREGAAEVEPAPEPPKDQAQLIESLRDEIEAMKQEKATRDLLESHSVEWTAVRGKAVAACSTDEEKMELVEGWKSSGKPTHSGRKQEQTGNFESSRDEYRRAVGRG